MDGGNVLLTRNGPSTHPRGFPPLGRAPIWELVALVREGYGVSEPYCNVPPCPFVDPFSTRNAWGEGNLLVEISISGDWMEGLIVGINLHVRGALSRWVRKPVFAYVESTVLVKVLGWKALVEVLPSYPVTQVTEFAWVWP
jgi:hypothetical protein